MPDPFGGSPRKLPGLDDARQFQISVSAGAIGVALQQDDGVSACSAGASSSFASSEHLTVELQQDTVDTPASHEQLGESPSLSPGPTLLSPGVSPVISKRPSDGSQVGLTNKIVDRKMYRIHVSPVPEHFADILTSKPNLGACVTALQTASLEPVLPSGCVVLVEPYQYAAVQGFASEAVLGPADVVVSGKYLRLLEKNLQNIRGLGFMECFEVPWSSTNYRPPSTERTGQSTSGRLSKLTSRLNSVVIRIVVSIILGGLVALLLYQVISILSTLRGA
eukprot:TRINITY_DN62692_c0_g1_i1.p1 TRINITY_DN62692_c0_g1~~TRINITY_DN62692_c0_g1_i1.p1  ORF type:complete len:278 (-),score=38.15 TRINITY_DN62692_c0_g1_i1:71-904(-)